MNRRQAIFLGLGSIALPLSTAVAQRHVILDELHGRVTEANFARFSDFILRSADKVIGMKILIERAEPTGPGLVAKVSHGQFGVYLNGSQADFGHEVVARSGFRYEHGSYVFDGFFVVKNGGMHQGTVSSGLMETSEAQIRLNPYVQIRRVVLR